jgi:hypothetical protein
MPAKGRSLMTDHIRLQWQHDRADDPVMIFYEVLTDRSVPRMVEVFADGRSIANTLASERQRHPGFVRTSLTDSEVPPIGALNQPGVLEASAIDATEFETVFGAATPLIHTPNLSRDIRT